MLPERKEDCDCGTLERCSKEPDHPIRYDERMNEYHLHDAHGQMLICYCPVCGGRMPPSRRASFFAHISEGEKIRLGSLLAGITTEKEVLQRFGRPDEEVDVGAVCFTAEKDGKPAHGIAARQLKYTRLSDVAEVIFQAYGDGRVSRMWYSKPLKKNGLFADFNGSQRESCYEELGLG
jgi:hypothetical protein